MPGLPTIALFLLATFVFAVIPGPAVLYIVTRGVAQGRRAGLASALGIGVGTLTDVAAAALGNLKTALFFYAFLPQFVDPAKGSASEQIAVLGALSVLLALCTDSAYGILAGTTGRWLQHHAGVRWARRYVTGSVYIGLGMSTALAGAEHK